MLTRAMWCNVVHNGRTFTPHPEAMTDRIRLTISVTPEAHDAFTRLAEASGLSLGRAMGDWLDDTRAAALSMAGRAAEVRRLPNLAAALMLDQMERTGAVSTILTRVGAAGFPPSSNTGGKSPFKPRKSDKGQS